MMGRHMSCPPPPVHRPSQPFLDLAPGRADLCYVPCCGIGRLLPHPLTHRPTTFHTVKSHHRFQNRAKDLILAHLTGAVTRGVMLGMLAPCCQHPLPSPFPILWLLLLPCPTAPHPFVSSTHAHSHQPHLVLTPPPTPHTHILTSLFLAHTPTLSPTPFFL